MNDNSNISSIDGLQALISRAGKFSRGPAPVEKWEPEFCGDLDMEIRRDGTWFYMGTPIGRHALVQLFATVLRKDDDGKTYLVTPVEKIGIRVEDAHFVAVEMNAHQVDEQQIITFRTNVGDLIEAGPDNPIRFVTVKENNGVKPYILVRGRLEALLARPVMYELIALGEEIEVEGVLMFCVKSKGMVFPIMASDDLQRLTA
ncbi:MAG: DUF1285 domain-containing protein [Hyphomicrobiales bacterium]|nr:DUF1285 domain-containing protein [Hyphomicrobiales bacterium]